jgi:hypothetical protein
VDSLDDTASGLVWRKAPNQLCRDVFLRVAVFGKCGVNSDNVGHFSTVSGAEEKNPHNLREPGYRDASRTDNTA